MKRVAGISALMVWSLAGTIGEIFRLRGEVCFACQQARRNGAARGGTGNGAGDEQPKTEKMGQNRKKAGLDVWRRRGDGRAARRREIESRGRGEKADKEGGRNC